MAFLFWSSFSIFALRLWLSLYGGLHPDEAYYWTWAQTLRLGYYDHPPMVAYIIRIGQSLFSLIFGSDYSGSRSLLFLSFRWLPDALGFIGLPCLVGGALQEFQRRRLTLSQIFTILSAPLLIFGAQIITPDLPQLIVWTGSLWVALKMKRKLRHALVAGSVTPFSWKFSIVIGILWALGAYSKYTAIFLPLLFILSGAGFWNTLVSGLVCLFFMSPYIYWTLIEALPNKMGIFYQLERGTNISQTEVHLKWIGDLIGAQLLFWSPAFCLDYFFSLKARRKMSWSMGAWIFLPLLFFSITGLRNRPEANWPAMGGIALMIFVLARHARRPVQLFWYSAVNYFLVVVALWAVLNQRAFASLIEPFAPETSKKLKTKVSRVEEFRGWENLRNLVFESTLIDQDPILIEKYHVISPILFFDAAARKDEKLGDRIKIDYQPGKSVSQFHFEDKYLPKNLDSYWYFKKGEGFPAIGKCDLRQSFVKADPMAEPFTLYKCKK